MQGFGSWADFSSFPKCSWVLLWNQSAHHHFLKALFFALGLLLGWEIWWPNPDLTSNDAGSDLLIFPPHHPQLLIKMLHSSFSQPDHFITSLVGFFFSDGILGEEVARKMASFFVVWVGLLGCFGLGLGFFFWWRGLGFMSPSSAFLKLFFFPRLCVLHGWDSGLLLAC